MYKFHYILATLITYVQGCW